MGKQKDSHGKTLDHGSGGNQGDFLAKDGKT
jgi:hypothetical protein